MDEGSGLGSGLGQNLMCRVARLDGEISVVSSERFAYITMSANFCTRASGEWSPERAAEVTEGCWWLLFADVPHLTARVVSWCMLCFA
jgi:hypothetical protein